MEQGPTFRISLPKYPAKDPHYRIVAHQRSRFTHYYFYVRDEPAGPATPSRQPARSRLSPRRCRHPTRRRSLGCSLIAPLLNDNVRLALSMIPRVRIYHRADTAIQRVVDLLAAA